MQLACLALSRALLKTGRTEAVKTPMMAITTRISINVNPAGLQAHNVRAGAQGLAAQLGLLR